MSSSLSPEPVNDTWFGRRVFTAVLRLLWWRHYPGLSEGALNPVTESESEVTQSCLTPCDLLDCSPPGSSVHGILQARVLEWVAIFFSRGSSQPMDWIGFSCTAGRFFTTEPPGRHNIGCLIERKRNQQNPLDPAFMKLTVKWGSSLFIKESQWRVY